MESGARCLDGAHQRRRQACGSHRRKPWLTIRSARYSSCSVAVPAAATTTRTPGSGIRQPACGRTRLAQAPRPSARSQHGMIFDSKAGKILLFGGGRSTINGIFMTVAWLRRHLGIRRRPPPPGASWRRTARPRPASISVSRIQSDQQKPTCSAAWRSPRPA